MLAWLVACSADRPSTPAAAPPGSGGVPSASEIFSEPVEYRARPPSAEAGEEYFARIGVGDPYGAGFPYPVFAGLQSLYPEELGRDWHGFSDAFGTIRNRDTPDDPHALPVGFHLTTDPETRVGFLVANCQLCHAEIVRAGGEERFVNGLGNKRVRLHAYDDALVRIAGDSRLDTARLLGASTRAARERGLAWPPDTRRSIVGAVLRKLRARAQVRKADSRRLAQGLPGRVATIEGFMLALNESTGSHLQLPSTIGWAKIPDIAPWRYRETNSFDGVAVGDPVAIVAEADFAFGVRPQWYLSHPHIATSIYLYLRGFSRELPFPDDIDENLAAVGERAFGKRCASCHGEYGDHFVGYEEQVVPQAVLGTDAARRDAVTAEFVEVAQSIGETRGLVVTRKSPGYVPRPLVDLWARGVYGHAGQWPDLATLGTPPEQRPRRFVVDLAAPLDLQRVGVSWSSDGEPGPDRYVYDGTKPGYDVGGHTFLSDLAPPERTAILEYLKTL